LAVEQAERYLRRVPKENRIERAPALELLVRVLTGLGELKRARLALAELTRLANAVTTIPLRAAASYASGCFALADSKVDAARQYFEDAVDLFLQCGAPYEYSRSRVDLAAALGKLGRIDGGIDEAKSAIQLLSKLGATIELARARSVLDSLNAMRKSAQSACSTAVRPKILTKREIEVLRLVADGHNNQRIAERLYLSDHTVHRHLANILNKLGVSTRAAAVARGTQQNLFP
jgi:LuxR family transcriptional regulator, maltose regulon positive regulatory protein